MNLARGFLILTGLILLGYGIFCLFNPMILSQYTGMGLTEPTALIEVRAMYGGLQCSVGLLFIYNGLHAGRTTEGLLLSVFIFAGLAGARAYGMTVDAGDNGYNFAAAIYEASSGLISLVLLQLSTRTTNTA